MYEKTTNKLTEIAKAIANLAENDVAKSIGYAEIVKQALIESAMN